ncbi:hypothetical protein [Rhizobium sp. SSA_523]|uniref:hypothetical protein n=1 Tax=Rhizobium sp. SSA_523 TaxID=2952477 RepID=UPI002091945D|nr:hypothetical protein [Rhizobium sp. SSA_523]MCO5733396.1 hypothetical protein [Rhizobium sp. SSA_523]WKC21629.1 hypothetical protein QTJ18_07085 [Rhizobium sp. SSA_523]
MTLSQWSTLAHREMQFENRPIGKTNRNGKKLVPNFRANETNRPPGGRGGRQDHEVKSIEMLIRLPVSVPARFLESDGTIIDIKKS